MCELLAAETPNPEMPPKAVPPKGVLLLGDAPPGEALLANDEETAAAPDGRAAPADEEAATRGFSSSGLAAPTRAP